MSKTDIRTILAGPDTRDVPESIEGIRKALEDALKRIEALEYEVAGLRGERPPRAVGGEDG